jgi:kynurenine 3-monooxygenase
MEVEIYERRPDMRVETISAGRSINLAMSARGLHALKEIGLDAEALREAVPMQGRMMHAVSGELTFQPYGKDDSDCIYSISRGGLNKLLMTYAEKTGNVQIRFNEKLKGYDLTGGTLEFQNEKSGKSSQVRARRVIGTDGAASVLRTEVMRSTSSTASEELLNYGYKEIQLPAGPGGTHLLAKNALHIWPRGTFMLIALPNFDGSFTCTLFLPHEGELSFKTLDTAAKVRAFFEGYFPDVLGHLPHYEEEFFGNPTGHMVTVRCSPWNIGDHALLLGDAAHAIVPFFGQGMNCGFEDCSILNAMMNESASWEELYNEFSKTRKPDSDAIADMAVENFVEMRDKVADPRFLLEKQVERILQKEFPDRFVSRYALVTFSRTPYRKALETGVVHQKLLGELCRGITQAEQVDLALARKMMDRLSL